jgi:hypothetical protein
MNLSTLNLFETFAPTLSAAEILVHGALLFLGLCVLLRILPKSLDGRIAISHLLFVVILGELVGEALSRGAKSLTDFLLVLLTVMLLGYAVDWLTSRSRGLARLVEREPNDGIDRAVTAPRKKLSARDPGDDEEAARRRRRRFAQELLARASAAES